MSHMLSQRPLCALGDSLNVHGRAVSKPLQCTWGRTMAQPFTHTDTDTVPIHCAPAMSGVACNDQFVQLSLLRHQVRERERLATTRVYILVGCSPRDSASFTACSVSPGLSRGWPDRTVHRDCLVRVVHILRAHELYLGEWLGTHG